MWSPTLTKLNYILAGLYPKREDAERVVDGIQIPLYFIGFKDKAVNNWHAILSEVKKRAKLENLLDFVLQEYPENVFLLRLRETQQLDYIQGPIMGEDIAWKTSDTHEKITGKENTLIDINFLEKGVNRARSVGRITTKEGYGSGFIIQKNLLVTNNHVISSEAAALQATFELNFELDTLDQLKTVTAFRLSPDRFFRTSVEDDWTVVAINTPKDLPALAFSAGADEVANKRVLIIQHPAGGFKQVGLFNNYVAHWDNQRIQYLTDTLPGSSGAPVFNLNWQLVAIHHSGGWLREPGTSKMFFRNEGINIKCLTQSLQNV